MIRCPLFRRAALAASTSAVLALAPAQTVVAYGQPCPAGTPALATQGLPRLGTTFTVNGVSRFVACTRRACPTPCTLCNTCSGPSFLVLGANRDNTALVLPGVTGNGCTILATQDVVLFGDAQGDVPIAIPPNPALIGAAFRLQRADTQWNSTTGSPCATPFQVLLGVGLSDGVECVIGP